MWTLFNSISMSHHTLSGALSLICKRDRVKMKFDIHSTLFSLSLTPLLLSSWDRIFDEDGKKGCLWRTWKMLSNSSFGNFYFLKIKNFSIWSQCKNFLNKFLLKKISQLLGRSKTETSEWFKGILLIFFFIKTFLMYEISYDEFWNIFNKKREKTLTKCPLSK